jgi:hypothetical protein
MMQMEDLLAAYLDAQDQGYPPTEILDRRVTLDQRAELESLLALVARLRHLGPPTLRREARELMASRLTAAMRGQVASSSARTCA